MSPNSGSYRAEGLVDRHGKRDERKPMIEEMAKWTRTYKFCLSPSLPFFSFSSLRQKVFIMTPFLFLRTNQAQLRSVSPQTGNYDAFALCLSAEIS